MKKLLYLVALLPLLFACSQEDVLVTAEEQNEGSLKEITAVMPVLQHAQSTRVTLSDDLRQFTWNYSDTIGIYSRLGAWTQFPLYGKTSDTEAIFKNFGFDLKPNESYMAFYPYQKPWLLNNFFVVYEDVYGNNCQVQQNNGSTDHLSKYNFMYGNLESDANRQAKVEFKMVGALLNVELQVPDATYTQLIVDLPTVTENIHAANRAAGVLSDGTVTGIPFSSLSLDDTRYSSRLHLKLNNIKPDAQGMLHLYMMIAPNDASNGKISLKLVDNKNNETTYQTQTNGENMESGKFYTISDMVQTEYDPSHDGVDLGITDAAGNKVLWATTNLGAENPWDYGGYYAWGETKAYGEEDTSNAHNYQYTGKTTYVKTYYDAWSTYKWAIGDSFASISKYSFDDSKIDGWWYDGNGNYVGLELDGYKAHTQLDPEDDAATVNWGNGWRMPTSYELDALIKNCYWQEVTSYNGKQVRGYIVYKAKVAAHKGKTNDDTIRSAYSEDDDHIFLPGAGERSNTIYADNHGYYWSSELYSNSYGACHLGFRSDRVYTSGYSRYYGQSIRPVYVIKQN